jgi:hypothetical protein
MKEQLWPPYKNEIHLMMCVICVRQAYVVILKGSNMQRCIIYQDDIILT